MPHAGGRPTVMTQDIIYKLEEAFIIGASDKEACLVANISMSTLYKYCQEFPEFSERKEELKDTPKYKARFNVSKAINEGDKQLSQWYLERKVKDEFAQRTEQTGDKGKDISVVVTTKHEELAKKFEEELKKGI